MVFNTGAALLDAIVLAVVSKEEEGTYGYKITQDVRSVLEVSESTLYPVLRRLQKDECLETYDMAYAGRNRRYYKITEKGMAQLNLYRVEWKNYSTKISKLFEGGDLHRGTYGNLRKTGALQEGCHEAGSKGPRGVQERNLSISDPVNTRTVFPKKCEIQFLFLYIVFTGRMVFTS